MQRLVCRFLFFCVAAEQQTEFVRVVHVDKSRHSQKHSSAVGNGTDKWQGSGEICEEGTGPGNKFGGFF